MDTLLVTTRSSALTRLIAGLSLVIAAVAMTGCVELKQIVDETTSQASPEAAPTDNDYLTEVGPAQIEYDDAKAGQVTYCDVDKFERATCAYGKLTSSQRDDAQREGRKDIFVDPAGWPEHNDEVDIPALESVTGSKDYHGWMFNRSHLLADSLGGSPDAENFVTGTRTQNVGSTQVSGQYAGGMAHTELIARDYLDDHDGDACPLYYAATPVYTDTELIPRTVIVDIQSCDKSIDARVEVSNTANGFEIDYTTGEYTQTHSEFE